MNILNKIKDLFSEFAVLPQNNLHDDFFSYIIDNNKNVDSYLLLYKKCTKCHSLKTNSEIIFSQDLKFGASINEVKKNLSSKKYNIAYFKSLNTKIILVRFIQNNQKVKCVLHFFENKLFLYSCTFSYLTINEKNEIIKSLQDKYLPGLEYSSKQNIVDSHNNCIQIDDSMGLCINYLSLNCDLFTTEKKTEPVSG